MLLKRHDVKTIVEILMGTEISDEEFEFNDLTISAVCEVMNQMMGAASTALSDFLGRSVNISTPQSFTLDDLDQFEREHFQYDSGMVVVAKFMLSIENVLKSEFVNVMSGSSRREPRNPPVKLELMPFQCRLLPRRYFRSVQTDSFPGS